MTFEVVFIHADGGSRGNPGIAGSGTVIYNAEHNQVLREISYGFAEKVTNNVAEYQGLINGLEAAAELGAKKVHVYLDSKLVVEQMSGRWKVKHPDMQRLAIRAKELVSGFEKVSFEWVRRELNKEADALANQAMDAVAAGFPGGFLDIDQPELSVGVAMRTASEAAAEAAADAADTTPTAAATKAAPGTSGVQAALDFSAPTAKPANSENLADPVITRIIFLRHGQTASSAKHLYAGLADLELTEIGKKQAHSAAKVLAKREDIAVILASPLKRAQQTAAAVAAATGAPIETEPLAIEIDFGAWDGLSATTVKAQDPELFRRWENDPQVAPPQGQSIAEFDVCGEKLLTKTASKYPGKTVVIVTHVHPIKAALRHAFAADLGFYRRIFLDLTGISVIEMHQTSTSNEPKAVVRLVNEVAHLV
ncbi:bifunctional RNase H/acid phosphatase [Corynebacterium caspium]|uniref:bifunctional RNase H/acid phosphatase n=1 Tax=Corynebacterium caspium TaxID=234828 RepID=UPI000361ECC0|nr:bifunctional RNase H/acid phosphatase [Corynebacterium caspium]WKD59665.1 Phosphoserine phosphatase 1 [Corynebacterium caspium DSM 44850]